METKKNKLALSTTTTVTTNFVGQGANELIGAALLEGTTIGKNLITIHPKLKQKEALTRLSMSSILQPDSAAWSPTGTVTFDERYLTPYKVKANVEVPIASLETMWLSLQMNPGANNSDLPASYGDYITEYFGKNIGQAVELAIWSGINTSGSNDLVDNMDGFVRLGLATATGAHIVAPTTLSASNILAEIAKVYAVIPSEVIDAKDLKIFVSKAGAKFYRQALAAGMGAGGNYYLGLAKDQELDYLGIPVVSTPGMPTNNMVAACSSNLFFGTDLTDDMSNVKVMPMADITGDETLRYKARFSASVNFAWPAECVFYGTAY